MASKRQTPNLTLTPDLPEVVSRDFNLFYKPDVAPVDESVRAFTQSLDSFVSGAGTAMVIQSEKKQKKEAEADAIKAYNDNRAGFNDAVKKGLIPKEANPYFVQKYQQLELNEKARQFKEKLSQEYINKGVKENGNVGAFDSFYKSELKKYFTDNQLGLFKPSDLAKSFFGKTDAIRDELFTQHSNAQMGKLSEQYRKNFKNDLQGFFVDDGSADVYKNIGQNISDYIKDKTLNGLSNGSARDYFLEALDEYVRSTNDFDFAQKILDKVPEFVQLGTGKLSDVKGLKDEFNKIQDALFDREFEQEERAIKQDSIKLSKDKRFIKRRLEDENFDVLEFKKSGEYNSLSREGKEFFETYYTKTSTAFSSSDNKEVTNRIDELITAGKYDEAEDYLLNVGANQLTKNTFKELDARVEIYKATQENGLINDRTFRTFKNDIDATIKSINKNGILIDPRITNDFDAFARQWLNENAKNYEKGSLKLKIDFKKAITEEYNEVRKQFLLKQPSPNKEKFNPDKLGQGGENNNTPKKEKADTTKLTRKDRREGKTNIADPELELDLSEVVIIPEGLSGSQLRKFRRDNPDAMSREEYDRIVQKQTQNNLAGQATDGGST